MKINCVAILLSLLLLALPALASPYPNYPHTQHVKPYVKKNGKFVRQYWRAKAGTKFSSAISPKN